MEKLKHKLKVIIIFISVVISMIGCTAENENNIIPPASAHEESKPTENINNVEYEIYSDKFEDINPENDTNMIVNYPQIRNLSNKNREQVINKLLEHEAISSFW